MKDTSRSFSAWSHVVSMMFAQIMHATSLNHVCDSLALHATGLSTVGRAKPPCRNTLSHANRTRDAAFIETLFWKALGHLQGITPGFGINRKSKVFPRRFRSAMIHAIDSTTIGLVANCMDWGSHRRRKAACKIHARIGVDDMLPRFAIVREAKPHDNTQARELCAGLRSGEIALFDRAYIDFAHFSDLNERGVFWVVRAKRNIKVKVKKRLRKPISEKQAEQKDISGVLRDDIVMLSGDKSRNDYPQTFRRVVARVEVDGRWMVMTFITNNTRWAPTSVAELYAARWSIEIFFKQIKGVLKLSGFLGHNLNAVRWQIWTALLVYVLMRYQAFCSQWSGSFARVITLVRGVIWDKIHLGKLLKSYGTAQGPFEQALAPRIQYLPGLEPKSMGQHPASS